MDSVYFDVNVFRDFCISGGKYYSQLARVQELVAHNRLRVFGSAKQLEELVRIPDRDAYLRLATTAFELVGKHVLRDRFELCALELRKRKQLSVHEACLPPALLTKVGELLDDPEQGLEIAAEVRAQHDDYKATFQDGAIEVRAELQRRSIRPGAILRETNGEWSVNKENVDEWIRSSGVLQERLGLPREQDISNWQMPVLRSWYAFLIAHANKTIIHSREIMAADRGDLDHYAYAAVAGLFVTEDKQLRDIASHIRLRHVRVLNGEEFFTQVVHSISR